MTMLSRKKQTGISLISLMVGLVISLIILLATVIVFKNLIRTSMSSKEDSINDAQRLSSILTSQLLVQSAGFAITSATVGTDLVVLSGASIDATTGVLSGTLQSVGTEGNAVVWGEKIGSTYQCAGLYSPSTGGMYRLGPQDCTSASAGWSTLAWTQTVLDNSSQSTTHMALSEKSGGCASFGIVGIGKVSMTFTTNTVRRDFKQDNNITTNTTQTSTSSSCLVNFPLS
ncbi:hypothetical protein KIK84_01055 [Curvibacter sp. CHRR-16]|uniref:PilW family protein n=1 Tax=Curvibacter sp. CHRR-16 TaxID=2835872 RepID=UPI001BDAB00B|nr:hypothetical protein [Curvibacter sp. CHRR-16]MBT0568901.1 hypothetical protein [Curvibacter sp. CHRR-16]